MAQTGYHDRRYFHFEGRVGHAACGLARQSLLLIYRELQLSIISDESWYQAILPSNPTVRGYLAEQMYGSLGLGKRVEVEYLERTPNWSSFFETSNTTSLNNSTILT